MEGEHEHVPGEGGWTPPRWVPPVLGACVGGGLAGVGAILASMNPNDVFEPRRLIGAFIIGCATGLTGYFGIKSAGVRKL